MGARTSVRLNTQSQDAAKTGRKGRFKTVLKRNEFRAPIQNENCCLRAFPFSTPLWIVHGQEAILVEHSTLDTC